MRGADHYAVLGLRPDAGRAEVDEAYRRLIKLYHPDRMGGDGSRAAEINRAYTMLRQTLPAPVR
jgi:molecular chaperone DnaJ